MSESRKAGIPDMPRWLACLALLLWMSPGFADDPPTLLGQSVAAVIEQFREQGYPFVYSSNLVDAKMLVDVEPEASKPVDIVAEILKPHGLRLLSESGVFLVVRNDRSAAETGSILLILTGERDDTPLSAANIAFDPPLPEPRRLESGVYEIDDVSPRRYELEIDSEGFAPLNRVVDVWPGETKVVNVRLSKARPEIETIAVSASRYEILRDVAPSQFSIDQRTIETMPDLGDDPLRAVHRLPGAAASGASAETYMRGGDRDEIGIMLNGQKLFGPFHIRDYQSIFSAIDSRALEGMEVYTGGFPVRYGNRMSGMVLLESLDPLEDRHTEVGLSVYNTSLLTAGVHNDNSWLLSARRGNIDLVISPDLGSPSYADVFGEYALQLTDSTRVSLNSLFATDRVEVVLESDPEELERIVSTTDNVQVWAQIDNQWSDTLASKTVLSATWFDNLRSGSLGDEAKIVASVSDDRQIAQYGFRQDFVYQHSEQHLLQWGLQVRRSSADYLYSNSAEYAGLQALYDGYDEPLTRNVAASPEGASYALYFSDRWKPGRKTTFEWGVRWDDQTYTDQTSDSQLSPRFSLLRALNDKSELRFSWGRYHQSQEINELQVEDGIANFWPAQRADQLIVSYRRRIDDRTSLRIEAFDKDIQDVRPRFENLFDPLGLIPEVQPDRVRLDPGKARSRGLEVSIDRRDGPWNWWATYVLSEATDRIDGRDELRSWDQRHAFLGGFSFSNNRWDFGLVANVHSGWPLTELDVIEQGVDPSGEPTFVAVPGARNAGRHEVFASLDLRVARKWRLSDGALTAFVEISNLTNRRNPCCIDWDLEIDEETGAVSNGLERGIDYWMPLLPAVGFLYEF